MFVIFGWNYQKISEFGEVEQRHCQNCKRTSYWQLEKISKYFTIFFIPIYSYNDNFWFHCPICNHGVELDNDQFKNYKSITDINNAFKNKTISENEWSTKLEIIYSEIDRLDSIKREMYVEESKKWAHLARENQS